MIIGACIIKHKFSLSDEETVSMIQENPYLQYLCGLSEFTDKELFDPSLFTAIRKRITIENYYITSQQETYDQGGTQNRRTEVQ